MDEGFERAADMSIVNLAFLGRLQSLVLLEHKSRYSRRNKQLDWKWVRFESFMVETHKIDLGLSQLFNQWLRG